MEFWNNSDICVACISEKKQQSKSDKNKLMAKSEVPHCVYMMLDKDNTVVYIGQTENIDRRMKQHCIFVSEDEIYTSLSHKYENTIIPMDNLPDIKRVKYFEFPNKYLSSVYEIHLITKYMPIYNTQYKYYSDILLELPDLDWNYYIPYSFYENLEFYYLLRKKLVIPKELKHMAKNFKTRPQAMRNLTKLYKENINT